MPPARRSIADRFAPKVGRGAPDECWPWLGRDAAKRVPQPGVREPGTCRQHLSRRTSTGAWCPSSSRAVSGAKRSRRARVWGVPDPRLREPRSAREDRRAAPSPRRLLGGAGRPRGGSRPLGSADGARDAREQRRDLRRAHLATKGASRCRVTVPSVEPKGRTRGADEGAARRAPDRGALRATWHPASATAAPRGAPAGRAPPSARDRSGALRRGVRCVRVARPQPTVPLTSRSARISPTPFTSRST